MLLRVLSCHFDLSIALARINNQTTEFSFADCGVAQGTLSSSTGAWSVNVTCLGALRCSWHA